MTQISDTFCKKNKIRIQFKILVFTFCSQTGANIRVFELFLAPRLRQKDSKESAFDVIAPVLWSALLFHLHSVDTVGTNRMYSKVILEEK